MRSERSQRLVTAALASLLAVAVVWLLFLGIAGGLRSAVGVLFVVALVLAAVLVAKRAKAPRALLAVLAISLVVSPWVFGLMNNLTQGWHDHVMYWGRFYNESHATADTELKSRAQSYWSLIIGGTPVPGSTPEVLVFRLPSGTYVVYELVGG